MQRGFTLIQLSLLTIVASLVLVACLPGVQTKTRLSSSTTDKMNIVMLALRGYETIYGSLPCPADASQPVGSSTYGVAAANPGTANNCAGGAPAANYTDSTNHVAIGMVPVRALGLSNEYALDAYGRKLTYAVDTNATQCFSGTLAGQITVTDNGVANSTVAVLVSHGADGHGAWVLKTGASSASVRLNSGSIDTDQLTNAHVDTFFNPTATLNSFVKKSPTSTFDDLVVYKMPLWNLNSPPAAAATLIPTVTPPANGTYIAGESLSFSASYHQTVAVSGAPRLTLTIGGLTRYATYLAGSGSSLLTFGYTLQSSDYAPTGISVASAIDLNNGTISPSCTSFSAPSLASVQVKGMYIYVADYNNNRVQKFDANGNYLAKFGSYGILGGLFNHPDQLAADSSGNIWVADFGNSRVEEFDGSGNYLGYFGSLGILNGQFINAASVAIDGSGNIWASDSGNNRVEKFNSSGTYQSKFGSAGTGNGQFLVPTGIATDASGNIWVGDWGNGRIEEFSSSGTYLGQIGSVGSGNGQFINPCGNAFDASGNIWLADNGNNRVEKFSSSGSYLGQFGSWGTGNGQFKGPCGIAIDIAGNIWVGDTGNNRVQKFNSAGSYQGQFGTGGSGNGQFAFPIDVTLSYQ